MARVHEFSSLMEMAVHLGEVLATERHAEHHGLEKAAVMIEQEAKRAIGEYQDGEPPFAAWAQLADSTVAEKEKLGFAPPDNPLLRTGALRDSIGHVVQNLEAQVGSNSEIAEYQELGTIHIPPRSFLGLSAARKADAAAEAVGKEIVVNLVGEEVFGGSLLIR